MIVSVKREKKIECKKGQILNAKKDKFCKTKWQNNKTREMGWDIWPQRETDHDFSRRILNIDSN